MLSGKSLRVGFFGNLDRKHGFGPLCTETGTKLSGVQVDHLDVHSVSRDDVTADRISTWNRALNSQKTPIQTVWAGFPGETYESILHTHEYGLVPIASRYSRLAELQRVIDLAKSLHAQAVGLHIGHLGNVPYYDNLVADMQRAANNCELSGGIVLETGQEHSDVLIQFLKDVNSRNLGVNFDPANLILYGSQDPIEAFKAVSPWVRSVHFKDAKWTTGKKGVDWGTQVDLGQGDVGGDEHFAAFLRLVSQRCGEIPCTIEFERFDGTHGSDEHWEDLARQFEYVQNTIAAL